MKRSDFFIRLMSAVVFLGLACYIGVYVYDGLKNSYETIPAVLCTLEETGLSDGYIVRSERVLTESAGDILPIVGEGEKVAAKQVIAVEYRNNAALEAAAEIRALRLRIEQLEKIPAHKSQEAGVIGADSVMMLSRAVHSSHFEDLEAITLSIGALVFDGGGSDLASLKANLAILEAANSGSRAHRASVSGVFSSVTDGFEHIGPDDLEGLTPAKLQELFKTNPSGNNPAGKLIYGIEWYYAAVMSSDDAARLTAGNTVTVQFTGIYHTAAEMTVHQIGRTENGKCVVLLMSNRGLSEIAPLRAISAEIQFSSVTGIHIPKEAIHLGDAGNTFVYLETGVRAEPVDVEIIGELGDGYVVKSGAETGTVLRPGAAIIVKANNLSDGKVVR